MSNSLKKRKSTKSKFETSRLIPIIAIVEALVLIAISTFAWFFLVKNKTVSSGIITVNADSGLDIDFKDADKSSYLDIFDYIDEEQFCFEPATSVDGKNIYFPTSGSFDNTNTSQMRFREDTVNDLNSKYIDIDFTLSNTTEEPIQVFLSNNSSFQIKDEKNNKVNGKALRIAFYNNDGNTGKVNSTFANKFKSADASGSDDVSNDDDQFTVYFYRDTSSWGENIKAYLWDSTNASDNTETVTVGSTETSVEFLNSGEYKAWPGSVCSNVSGNVYSYTFQNPYKTKEVTSGEITGIAESKNNRLYNKIIFNDGSNKTATLTIANGHIYHSGLATDSSGSEAPAFKTVYFLKPKDWTGTPLCAVKATINNADKWYGEKAGGYPMKESAVGVYSYTFPEGESGSLYDKLKFTDSDDANRTSEKTVSGTKVYDNIVDKALYYFPTTTLDGVTEGYLATVSDYSDCNLYFYNSMGWDHPYANINALADTPPKYQYSIPMIDLTGGLFYCEVPSVYMNDKMSVKDDSVGTSTISDSGLAANCKVYFSGKNSSGTEERTESVLSSTNFIYTPTGSASPYSLSGKNYETELNVTNDSYAVISPGVSAGFQRAANPVKEITSSTGMVNSIIPTFASSFDDFIVGSGNPVFTIGGKSSVNMSMIIWLEGTDEHCSEENYAGKSISMYLEFSTKHVRDESDDTYTYRFTDSTVELWTSDTQEDSVTHVKVNPVIQLYDVEAERGYIMSPKTYSNYKGANKVQDWECIAPRALTTNGHHIEFRRVNPYNESEIWNYWQAGVLSDYKTYALTQSTNTVTFTALGDSSPSYKDYGDELDIPELSCGGLWGSFETDMLYVYDGRKTRNIEDGWGGSGETGYLFCDYEYQYPNGGPRVRIQYKASSDKAFFGFIIPASLYAQKPDITFPNYVCLSAYAINSDKQKGHIHHRNTYDPVGTLLGRFYCLNSDADQGDALAYDHSYWGSDVIYVQATNRVGFSFINSYAFYQIQYHGINGTKDFYSYMYENNSFADIDTVYNAFVSIVPCGGEYDTYRFEAATHESGHNNLLKYDDTAYELEQKEVNGINYNIVKANSSSDDGRIMKIESDFIKIYYRNKTGGNDYYDGNITVHYWNSQHFSDSNYGMQKTGKTDDFSQNLIYYAYIPSDCTFAFKGADGNIQSADCLADYDYEGTHYVVNGYIYVPHEDFKNGVTMDADATDMGGNTSTQSPENRVGTARVNNTSWPEYYEILQK